MTQKVEMSIRRIDRIKKTIYQTLRYPKGFQKCVMILGCQRSGTTLLSNVFSRIKFCKVYGEFSPISNQASDRIRLNPIDDVLGQFNRSHAPLIVCKPLVESQHANQLLADIPHSSAIWFYRNYKDVGLSDIRKFKTNAGHGNIKAIVNDLPNNWRNEAVSAETRHLINEIYSPELTPLDCACLFWYLRNSLFFEQQLQTLANVRLWRYEDFVENPLAMVNELLTSNDLPVQQRDICAHVFGTSVSAAVDTELEPGIDHLCKELFDKLMNHSNQQMKNRLQQ